MLLLSDLFCMHRQKRKRRKKQQMPNYWKLKSESRLVYMSLKNKCVVMHNTCWCRKAIFWKSIQLNRYGMKINLRVHMFCRYVTHTDHFTPMSYRNTVTFIHAWIYRHRHYFFVPLTGVLLTWHLVYIASNAFAIVLFTMFFKAHY